MKQFIPITMFIMMTSQLWAQGDILDNYIRQGLENNLALRQENLDLSGSLEALRQARAMFMPGISFRADYTLAAGGRTIAIPIGDLLNPVYASLNQLTDSQGFPTNLENANEQLLPNHFHDTRIEIRQALFDPDILFNYRARESFAAAQKARRNALTQELGKEIKVAYYQYLTAVEAIEIFHNTKEMLQELLRVNRRLVENHKATVDAVYQAEYELSDLASKMAEAHRVQIAAKSYFNFLLNRSLDDSVQIDPYIADAGEYSSSAEALQQNALVHRNELKQLQHTLGAREHLLSLYKNTRLPKLTLGINVGYQGFNYRFDQNQDYALAQFSLAFPLFKGFANKSRISEEQIAVQSLQVRYQETEQQIRMQVINALQDVAAARSSVTARKAALKSAEKSFELISRKYLENQSTLLELLDARNKYTNSQLELVLSRYDMLKKQAVLEQTTAMITY